jgi:hypothetical protein
MLICLYGPLTLGWLSGDSLDDLMAIGALLGVAGASVRRRPAARQPLVSAREAGPGDGHRRGRQQRHGRDQPDRAAPRPPRSAGRA